MKKIISTLSICAVFATISSADIARVEMGAGMWAQTPSGIMSYTESGTLTGTYTSDKKEDTGGYAWMLIKHPIPILPNLRLEYANMKDTGIVDGDFKDFVLPGGVTNTPGSIEITQFDVIPYYNILDNTFWTTVDLGLDLKIQQTDYKVNGVEDSLTGLAIDYEDSVSSVIPLIYARARVEIPGTNIGFEADGKYISYDGSTVYDARAKIDYTFDFIPVVQPAIEIGYRVQKFDITYEDGADTTVMDMEFSGVYAGLMLRF